MNAIILLWGWNWDHQTYSREGYGSLGVNIPYMEWFGYTSPLGSNPFWKWVKRGAGKNTSSRKQGRTGALVGYHALNVYGIYTYLYLWLDFHLNVWLNIPYIGAYGWWIMWKPSPKSHWLEETAIPIDMFFSCRGTLHYKSCCSSFWPFPIQHEARTKTLK